MLSFHVKLSYICVYNPSKKILPNEYFELFWRFHSQNIYLKKLFKEQIYT